MRPHKRARPRLRFIPFRKRDVVEMCLASGGLSGKSQMQFREFCQLLQSVFHFEYHELLENLKNAYAPLNPDRDTRQIGVYSEKSEQNFAQGLHQLLDKANYEQFSDEELQRAIEDASLFQLRLHIDFSEFEEVLLYTRGEAQRTETTTRFFGLFKREVEFFNFDRVVIYIQFRNELAPGSRHKPGSSILKLFQNVPRADVEMLFPNTKVGMRLIDKLMIGVPAIVGGGVILTTKLGTSLLLLGALVGFWLGLSSKPVVLDQASLLVLVAGVGALGSFIWRQFTNFKNRKLRFLQSLMENLYFRNLDNNAGVYHRLIDDAEEEECKEAFIGYYFLLTNPAIDTAQSLDAAVEQWFESRWDSEVDFEVEDALDKLLDLGLVTRDGDKLQAVDLQQACRLLDRRWDEYFAFNND